MVAWRYPIRVVYSFLFVLGLLEGLGCFLMVAWRYLIRVIFLSMFAFWLMEGVGRFGGRSFVLVLGGLGGEAVV